MSAVLLPPCPFCEGPPCPFVQNGDSGAAPSLDDYGDAGLEVCAFVFCHECGSQGPEVEEVIYDRDDYFNVERAAVELWCRRDNRHRDLYDAGAPDGLNLYPRPDEGGDDGRG